MTGPTSLPALADLAAEPAADSAGWPGLLLAADPAPDALLPCFPLAALAVRGTCAVIPPRRKRRYPRAYDAARYAQRHPVERLFSRLKQFRRVATRYDKLDTHFLAFVHLAATVLWLRDC